MTLTFKQLPSKAHRPFHPCQTPGCVSRSSTARDTGRREATVVAYILGRPTYLCPGCAKEWKQAWGEADAPYQAWLDSPGGEFVETLFPVETVAA